MRQLQSAADVHPSAIGQSVSGGASSSAVGKFRQNRDLGNVRVVIVT